MQNKNLTEKEKQFLQEVFKRTMDNYKEAIIKLQNA
jgi:flagellar motor switch protein FliM